MPNYRYDATKTVKDFAVGDRVGYYDGTMGRHTDCIRRGTVTKVGRKYIYITLDRGIPATGGRGRSVIGVVTIDQAVFPGTLTILPDEE